MKAKHKIHGYSVKIISKKGKYYKCFITDKTPVMATILNILEENLEMQAL